MKAFLTCLILVLCPTIALAESSKAYAFMCAWDDGDMVFATSVREGQKEVVREYRIDGVTYKVVIKDLKSRVTYPDVTISSPKKITVKWATCLMETE